MSFSEVGHPIRAVFVGREWKRKGPRESGSSVGYASISRVMVTLDVFGPEKSELKGLHLPDWIFIERVVG